MRMILHNNLGNKYTTYLIEYYYKWHITQKVLLVYIFQIEFLFFTKNIDCFSMFTQHNKIRIYIEKFAYISYYLLRTHFTARSSDQVLTNKRRFTENVFIKEHTSYIIRHKYSALNENPLTLLRRDIYVDVVFQVNRLFTKKKKSLILCSQFWVRELHSQHNFYINTKHSQRYLSTIQVRACFCRRMRRIYYRADK